MKHVLFIAYYYYQKESVASNRTYGLFNYLPEFGWGTTLITLNKNHTDYIGSRIIALGNSCSSESLLHPTLTEMQVLNPRPIQKALSTHTRHSVVIGYNLLESLSKHKASRKILHHLNTLLLPLSSPTRWKYSVLVNIKKELQKNKYDVLLSTYNPAAAHQACSIISKKYDITWVADYRDLWSQSHYYIPEGKTAKEVITRKELDTLHPATYLTTVSRPLADNLHKLHGKPVFVIPNGFDPEMINTGATLGKKFTITYTGTLYHGKGSQKLLFTAMHELMAENKINPNDISIDFYGSHGSLLSDITREFQLEGLVFDHGSVSKEESIHLQWSSQILLLLTWDNPAEVGVYTGKVFEYLAAKRPILSLGYHGQCIISDLLAETNAGVHPLTYDELKQQVLTWYLEWKETGAVSHHGIDEKIDQYSYRGMAKKFADVLDAAIQNDTVLYQKNLNHL